MNAQEALEWYDEAVDHCTDYLGLDREEQQSAWNAIQSLIDSAMPVSDEVQRAIGCLETERSMLRYQNDLIELERELVEKSFDLAIQALKQYQEPKPCKWCINVTSASVDMVAQKRSATLIGTNKYNLKRAHFCPNCGRKIGE